MDADPFTPVGSAAPAALPLPETLHHPRLGAPSRVWHYRDAAARLLFAVARFDPPGRRKEVLPYTCDRTAWAWRAPPEPRPLYGLPDLAARPHDPVLIVEGEKAADAARDLFPAYVAVTWQGGSSATGKADWRPLRGRRVTVWPDNDAAGRKAAADIPTALAAAGAASVTVVDIPADWPEGWDVADPLPPGITRDRLLDMLAGAQTATGDPGRPWLRPVSAAELLAMRLPPRQYALAPVLPVPGLAMLYAPRGMGKTYMALSIAHAVASGGAVMKWRASQARRVLYVDGEMPAGQMQERLALIMHGADRQPPDADYLRFLSADLLPDGLPNLARPQMQDALAAEMEASGAEVLILDNLSTLAAGLRENEADDWGDLQAWLLGMRRAGRHVLLIHHAGKGGQQRGTSRREDALDTVIALRRPADYDASQGARFEVHVEKARGAMGADVAPFSAALVVTQGGGVAWTWGDLADAQRDRAAELLAAGMSIRDVAEATGLSRSAVHRLSKRQGGEAPHGRA